MKVINVRSVDITPYANKFGIDEDVRISMDLWERWIAPEGISHDGISMRVFHILRKLMDRIQSDFDPSTHVLTFELDLPKNKDFGPENNFQSGGFDHPVIEAYLTSNRRPDPERPSPGRLLEVKTILLMLPEETKGQGKSDHASSLN